MKPKRVSEFLTEDEITAILRVPDRRTLQGKRDYALLLLMFSTGLRKAEVCGLRVEHVTTYRNQPVVDVMGKGEKHRRVALNRDVMEAVLDYQKAMRNADCGLRIFRKITHPSQAGENICFTPWESMGIVRYSRLRIRRWIASYGG